MRLLLLASLQIQLGSIGRKVVDPTGGSIRGALAVLVDGDRERGSKPTRPVASSGGNLPYVRYRLPIHAAGFRTHEEELEIRSNLTREVLVSLALSGTEEALTVRAEDRPESSVSTRIDEEQVEHFPGASVGGPLQPPPDGRPDNGLVHNRGVDDGLLYVGGIPWFDRPDRFAPR